MNDIEDPHVYINEPGGRLPTEHDCKSDQQVWVWDSKNMYWAKWFWYRVAELNERWTMWKVIK